MPAKSKSQQRLFSMALAVRKGDLKRSDVYKSVLDIVDSDMTDKEIEDFTVLKENKITPMIPLYEFLTQPYIFETSIDGLRYLIGEFSSTEDETLLSGEQFYDISTDLQDAISKDDLRKIFEYGKSHKNIGDIKKRPEPLVANYDNKHGKFAFRRWVRDAVKELGIKVKGTANKLYHDTNLKGNGLWVPTAQDMEDVISIGYNNINKIKTVLKESYIWEANTKEKIELIITYYQENKETIDTIAKQIKSGNSPLGKLPSRGITGSVEWAKLGRFASTGDINNTPKTDIISADHKLRISCKEKGGSQLMSGGYHEAVATILTAIDKSGISGENVDELKKSLDTEWVRGLKDPDGIAKIKTNPNHPLYELINNADKLGKYVQNILNQVIKEYPAFEDALLYEAMTGEVKFGINSPAAANYILVWDDNSPENSQFYTPEEYVTILKMHKIQYLINFKSANGSSWQNMRIVCGDAKSTDSEKVKIKPI